MESSSEVINMINETIEKIITMLEEYNEKYWEGYFKYVLEQLKKGERNDEIVNDLRILFRGGMGSFNDVALHKNRKVVDYDNDKLRQLRKNLFQLVVHQYKFNDNNENVVDLNKKSKDDAV